MRNKTVLLIAILGIIADGLVWGVIFKGQELGFWQYVLIGAVTSIVITAFAWGLWGRGGRD